MSAALGTLLSLRARGARIWVENGQLRFQAPKGTLNPDDYEQLRILKSEIVTLISADDSDYGSPLRPRLAADLIPLTPLQELVLSRARRTGPRPRLHRFAIQFLGKLNTAALRESVGRVVNRHEALRTRIDSLRGGYHQLVTPVADPELPIVQFPSLRSSDPERTINEVLTSYWEVAIDPLLGPLFESRLFRVAPEHHILALSADELIMDCISNEIITREVANTYVEMIREQPPSAPAVQLHLPDFAVWLGKIEPTWIAAHASHWRASLADVLVSTPLGTSVSAIRNSTPISAFDEDTTERLLAFARQRETFPAVITLAAYGIAISHWFGVQDFTVQTVDSGRHRPELQNMIGGLVDLFFLRFHLDRNQTFEQVIRKVSSELDDASQHRDFNFVPSLLPDLHTDFFFNWVTSHDADCLPHDEELQDLGVSMRRLPVEANAAHSALAVYVRHDSLITAHLTYDPELLPHRAASDFATLLQSVLRRGIQEPESIVGSLTLCD